MAYNVKVNFYPDEVQLSIYDYMVGPYYENIPQKKEKRSFEDFESLSAYDEQPFSDDIQLSKVDDSLNKVRSCRRSKQIVYDYARSNNWEWFSTFTFADHRYNYDLCLDRLSVFLHYFKSRFVNDLEWLIVPEQHKDGAWHFHGLFIGNIKPYLVCLYEAGKYQLPKFKHGLTQFERVKDTKRVSSYICKYITKDLSDQFKGRKRYLVSRGLLKSTSKTLTIDTDNQIQFIVDNFPDYYIDYVNYNSYMGKKIQYIQLRRKKGE